jgi:tetratricopeptide (TPR) repeat protein
LAVVSGNRQAAFQLYERTLAADPTEHVALNNLAFLTGDSTPSDLPKALSLVNRAIELEPENPHYYETRGQILFKQQDWAAAVRDLRRALNGMPHKREIHRSLAIACREIGELEAARQHAVLAQQ